MVDPDGPRNPWGAPQRPQNNNNQNQGPGPRHRPQDWDGIFAEARKILNGDDGRPNWGVPLLIIVALWMSTGLYVVGAGENAVIQRFGAWTRTQTEPGIGFHLPFPVESRNIVNTQLDRRLTIGVQGERMTGQGLDESLMLTGDTNIVDVNVVVLWNISRAEDYLFNVADPDLTIKQVAESALREAVGQTPLQKIITEGRNDVALQAQQRMQAILDSYKSGVSVKQVLIQEATVHPDVIEAFDDVVAARQDAERFQNEATIYRNEIIPTAKGEATKLIQAAEAYKTAQIAKATGDAERFNSIYGAYVQGKDVTRERIYIETMEEVLKSAHTTVLDSKAGQSVPVVPISLSPLPAAPAATGGKP